MKAHTNNTEDTLITFHIGRGGKFFNSGFKKYVEQDNPINKYTDDLFIRYENHSEILKLIGKRKNLRDLYELASETHITDEVLKAQKRIEKLTSIEFGELVYVRDSGYSVDLNVDNDGTGCIDIDGDYDTTFVCRLKECTEEELELIYNSQNYKSLDVEEFCKEKLEYV